MPRLFAKRLLRRPTPPPLSVFRLEDRLAPALFAVQSPSSPTGQRNHGSSDVGDFNGDGKQDVVLGNFGFDQPSSGLIPGNKLTVMLGQGNGQFGSQSNLTVGSGQYIAFVTVADVNNDGKADILCSSSAANTTAGELSVFLGDGKGGFATPLQVPTNSFNVARVSVAQLTSGDTDLDVVVSAAGKGASDGSSLSGNGFTVFQGDGKGGFSQLARVGDGVLGFTPTSQAVADFNADGKQDLAFTNPGVPADTSSPYPDGSVDLYLNNGAGGFTAGNSFSSGGPFPVNVQVADLNADGKPDLVTANVGQVGSFGQGGGSFGQGTAVGVLIGTGGGNFLPPALLTAGLTGSSTATFAVAAADFDGDGKQDLAAITYGDETGGAPGKVAAFLGDGVGNFTPATGSPFSTGQAGGQYISVADFDGNGTPDLVAVGTSGKVVSLLNQSVAAAATSTALASSLNPSTYGASVTFTATVTSAGGTPTVGTVTFFDGATQLGTPVAVDATGTATLATSGLSAATHTVTAKYSGGTGFAASTSSAVSQVVSKASTTTALTANPLNPTSGSPVTLTATVTSPGGIPTGSVTFFDGTTALGGPVTLTAGSAQLVISTLAVGAHQLTAAYTATTNFAASTSAPVTVTVANLPPPTVTPGISLGAAPNPSEVGQAVTFTATVTATAGTPAGTVTFFDGTTALGTAVTLAGSPPTATLTTSALTLGAHAITAQYGGGAGFNPVTSAALTQTVNAVTTGVTLATDVTPATVTLPVTFTATVTATTGSPAGGVRFFDGAAAISKVVPLGAGGTATFTTADLLVGSHAVTAKFVPATADYAASESLVVTQAVQKAGVTITVTSGGPAVVTQPVTLTATFAKVPVAVAADPAGQVTFKLNGTTTLGTALVTGGTAVLTTSALPVGGGVITAEFAGDATFTAGTSAGFTQGVTKGGVTVTLAGAGPATVGQTVSFQATVAEVPALAAADPTGLVTFKAGGTVLGTAAISGGVAIFTTSTLPVGASTVTAEYAGDATFVAGASGPVTQQMLPVNTGITLATVSSPLTVSQTVTFTATVTAASGTPTGTVQFLIGGTAVGGPVPTVSGKATYTTTALPVGTTTVTAQFTSTDATFAGSTSPALTQTVIKAAPALALTVTPGATGQPAALRAAVSSPAGVTVVPSGTVTFKVNGTAVGSAPVTGGVANTTTTLPVGTSTVTAEFAGDGNFTTGAVSTTATTGGGPGLVGYREYGVGAGAGRAADARFFNPDGTERFTAANLFDGTGGVRVTSADFNNDGVADLVAGTGPGGPSRVVVLDGKSRAQLFSVDPFEATFVGGVYVTTGDVDGDGVPDLVISPDEGGGPRTRVFSGAKFGQGFAAAQIADFFGIDDPAFRGGARAAVSDLNGDGVGDLVVAAGFGGGPRVAVYNGKQLASTGGPKLYPDFFVFEQGLRNGAFVAAGDVDGDGVADLISGGGPGGGPRVTILSGADLLAGRERQIANFFAGDQDNRGGVRVVARDLDGDKKADLVVGAGPGAGSRVTAYSGTSLAVNAPTELYHFDAFPGFTGGVYVG